MTFYVLLHGFPDLPTVWDPLLEHLPKDQKVIVPNLWELGTENKKALDSEQVAAKVYFDLRKLGFKANDDLVILGHDLGAAYAIALSKLAPEQTTLVLMNGMSPQMLLARMGSSSQAVKSWYVWLMQIPLLPKGILLIDKKLPARIAKVAHRPRTPAMCDKSDFLRGMMMYRRLFREAFLNPGKKPVKAKKVIVIWGIQDPFLNTPTEFEFAPLAHQVEIHLLNDHHWPQLHSPQKVAEIIHANA